MSSAPLRQVVLGCIRKQAVQARRCKPVIVFLHVICLSFALTSFLVDLSLYNVKVLSIPSAFGHGLYHSNRNQTKYLYHMNKVLEV